MLNVGIIFKVSYFFVLVRLLTRFIRRKLLKTVTVVTAKYEFCFCSLVRNCSCLITCWIQFASWYLDIYTCEWAAQYSGVGCLKGLCTGQAECCDCACCRWWWGWGWPCVCGSRWARGAGGWTACWACCAWRAHRCCVLPCGSASDSEEHDGRQ